MLVGDSAVMECMAAGSPKPRLFWFKDGAKVEQTEKQYFAAEEQLLVIVSASREDSGRYTLLQIQTAFMNAWLYTISVQKNVVRVFQVRVSAREQGGDGEPVQHPFGGDDLASKRGQREWKRRRERR